MAMSSTRRMPSSGGKTKIQELEVDQFARRLYKLMNAQGLSQSDLAKKAFGTKVDARGYTVAKNRDRISVYFKGKSLPDPKNLELLATALNMSDEDLAPDIAAATIDRENPEVAMTAIAGHHDRVHLELNKLVPMALASKIISMISEYDEINNSK